MPIFGPGRDRFIQEIDRRRGFSRELNAIRQRTIGSHTTTQVAVYDAMFRSDREAVTYHYATANDHLPDLDDPTWINEKIRWQFLNHPNPLMTICSDKIAVRDYLEWRGARIRPPAVVAFGSDPAEIEGLDLPERFVLKSTFASGQNHLETGNDRRTSPGELATKVRKWNAWDFWRKNGELHYRDIPKRWLIEEFVPASVEKHEYKIFCILGEPVFIAVITDRNRGGDATLAGVRHALFDTDWKRLDIGMQGVADDPRPVPRPRDLDMLLSEARRVAEGFLHVRVDYLRFDGRWVFSELTFSSLGARLPFTPIDVNARLGAMMDLNKAPEYLMRAQRVAAQLHDSMAA